MDREKVNYAAIVCARNEERYIEDCMKAVLNQTLQPYTFLIIDDGSTDSTRDIIAKHVYGSPHVKTVTLNHPRSNVRGVNTVQAINKGIDFIRRHAEPDYLLTVDADIKIPSDYMETILKLMEEHPEIGLSGGFSKDAKFSYEHIPNGARVYRWNFINKIGEVPPITGFDSWLKFKIRQLGYEVRGCDIRYEENRPPGIKNSIHRHFFWGRATYLIGQPSLIALPKAFRYMKHKPHLIGALVFLLSYFIHKLTGWKPFSLEYYRYVDDYFKRLIRRGVRHRIGGILR